MTSLRAPFPYYGFKGAISARIWEYLGSDVGNYVEPFFGSGAVLLQRPGGPGGREVVNDRYGLLANFWRSVIADHKAVAKYAVHVRSESDLHARNAACRESLDDLTARIEGDPEYYDPKLAGWWCYVQCMAIGEAAFARGPWVRKGGRLVSEARANGIRRSVPCESARGIQKSIPFHGRQGIFARKQSALAWLEQLQERLHDVMVLCGDWSRICKPTYTLQHGLTAVYLDPPYDTEYKLYANSAPLLPQIFTWCLENGADPNFRIVLSGYEGTFPVDLRQHGWRIEAWTARGGRVTSGGQSDDNRKRERLLISPHCLVPGAADMLPTDVPGQLLLGGEI